MAVSARKEGKNEQRDHGMENVVNRGYEFGVPTTLPTTTLKTGLTKETIDAISTMTGEPQCVHQWRLDAHRHWKTLHEPHWADISYDPIDYQNISYFAAPTSRHAKRPKDVDPEIRATFEKLGIPLEEQRVLSGVAIDAILDSASVITTYKNALAEHGIIFCSMSEALREHTDLVMEHLGTVVPPSDNFFAALNSAVFSDGSFVYIPKGVRCPMDLSTYFRMNAPQTGQFERTLIIADEGASVNYLEGCTAPMRKDHQLHAAVVEIIARKNATVNYATVQNWYPGDKHGKGGVLNFVTKRGLCQGENARISWTQVETGSAMTWKYPSVILQGNGSSGEFRSMAITTNRQQADTGSKMIHIGNNTTSTIIAKSIAANASTSTTRNLVTIHPRARNAKNFTQCDSLLIGDACRAFTRPTIITKNATSRTEHEATTTRISERQRLLCAQRGLPLELAMALIVNGFAEDVTNRLPLEFAVEAKRLLGISLEQQSVDIST